MRIGNYHIDDNEVNEMKGNRICELDIAKGIGILLVILGHCTTQVIPALANLVNSFHMPLFFLLSGMVYKSCSLDELVSKRFRSIGIPLIMSFVYNEILLLASYFAFGGGDRNL